MLVQLTGQRFALREGGRTVGAGVVSKVLGWASSLAKRVGKGEKKILSTWIRSGC